MHFIKPYTKTKKIINFFGVGRVPAPKVLKWLFKAFSFNNSRPIQCPSSSRSIYSIQPYWYSRKKYAQIWGTDAWYLL